MQLRADDLDFLNRLKAARSEQRTATVRYLQQASIMYAVTAPGGMGVAGVPMMSHPHGYAQAMQTTGDS